jgi:DNA-directed RNA polymerase subunit beta
VPSGAQGTIIDAQVFARKGAEPDERSKAILEEQGFRDSVAMRRLKSTPFRQSVTSKVIKLLDGASTTGKLLSEDGSQELLREGPEVAGQGNSPAAVPFDLLGFIPVKDELEQEVTSLMKVAREKDRGSSLHLQGKD